MRIPCRPWLRTSLLDALPSSTRRIKAFRTLVDLRRSPSCMISWTFFAKMCKPWIRHTKVRNNNSKMTWKLTKIMRMHKKINTGLSKCPPTNKHLHLRRLQVSLKARVKIQSQTCTSSYKTQSTYPSMVHWNRCLSSFNNKWATKTNNLMAWTVRFFKYHWRRNSSDPKQCITMCNTWLSYTTDSRSSLTAFRVSILSWFRNTSRRRKIKIRSALSLGWEVLVSRARAVCLSTRRRCCRSKRKPLVRCASSPNFSQH